jgi:hypothetical protein
MILRNWEITAMDMPFSPRHWGYLSIKFPVNSSVNFEACCADMTLACAVYYSDRARCALEEVGIFNFNTLLKNTESNRWRSELYFFRFL